MEAFFVFLTLSSLTGPQVRFISQRPWNDSLSCARALPKMENVVARIARHDSAALELIGTVVGGPIKPGYFVTASECRKSPPAECRVAGP
jgi:hypothetical protein